MKTPAQIIDEIEMLAAQLNAGDLRIIVTRLAALDFQRALKRSAQVIAAAPRSERGKASRTAFDDWSATLIAATAEELEHTPMPVCPPLGTAGHLSQGVQS